MFFMDFNSAFSQILPSRALELRKAELVIFIFGSCYPPPSAPADRSKILQANDTFCTFSWCKSGTLRVLSHRGCQLRWINYF